ncbi:GCN5 family acetyltransferase [alpha proteobacterium AAP81b]|nr:GCN5 family acetyltransferase [alpha proteobacterium AAP81b]
MRHLRPATPADADAIAAIYAWHVAHGGATFDTVAPDAAAHAGKIGEVAAAGWPYLVAEDGGEILGYAYATQIRPRAAYAHTAEDSIYIRHDARGRGLGRTLLTALLDAAVACDFRQMIAVIGDAEAASVGLHAAHGFVEVGRLRAVGWKFGRWMDVVYMQRPLP